MAQDIPPEIAKVVPGFLGSLVALRWIPGSPLQRVSAIFGGSAASYYCAEFLTLVLGTDRDLTAFLVGLFGMALAAKVFETLAVIDFQKIVDKLLQRWLP